MIYPATFALEYVIILIKGPGWVMVSIGTQTP